LACGGVTVEIEEILRTGMERLVSEVGIRRCGFKLLDILRHEVIKKVDLDRFMTFKEVVLMSGTEFLDGFVDSAKEDQMGVQELSHKFFEVFSL